MRAAGLQLVCRHVGFALTLIVLSPVVSVAEDSRAQSSDATANQEDPTRAEGSGEDRESETEEQVDVPAPRSPRFVGPDAVDNQLESDSEAKKTVVRRTFLKPYFDWKSRLKEQRGLAFGVDYSAVYLGASESVDENGAAGGMARFYGSWDLVGRRSQGQQSLTSAEADITTVDYRIRKTRAEVDKAEDLLRFAQNEADEVSASSRFAAAAKCWRRNRPDCTPCKRAPI